MPALASVPRGYGALRRAAPALQRLALRVASWPVRELTLVALLVVSLVARVALAQEPTASGAPAAKPPPSAAPTTAASAPPTAQPPASSAPPAVVAPGRAWVPEPPTPEAVMKARATPRRSIAGFLRAAGQEDYARAADFLDLRSVARERRDKEGAELAEKLYRVITWRVVVNPEAYPDDPETEAQRVVIDSVDLEGTTIEISLAPVKIGAETAWQFSKDTVANVRALFELNQRRWLEERVPKSLRTGDFLGLAPWQWIGFAVVAAAAFAVALMIGRGGTWLTLRALSRAPDWARALARAWGKPGQVALFAVTFTLALPYLVLSRRAADGVGYFVTTAYIVAIGWALIAALRVGTTSYVASLPQEGEHEIAHRGLVTRMNMVRRIGTVLVAFVAVGVALLQFDVVRNVGLSLLASAGIAGVLVGFAAQRTLGGIISGIEISITQPLRMGDVVTIEGNEGRVERIYFTYVVVRLIDDRRLIVPVQQVMSKSFENLTLTGADLLVHVELFVDYETPVDLMREEFERICKERSEWDGRRAAVMVIDCTDKALRLRGIASTDDASKNIAFRAALRERWIRFLQTLEGGKFLPRGRVTTVEPNKEAIADGVSASGADTASAPAPTGPADGGAPTTKVSTTSKDAPPEKLDPPPGKSDPRR